MRGDLCCLVWDGDGGGSWGPGAIVAVVVSPKLCDTQIRLFFWGRHRERGAYLFFFLVFFVEAGGG